MTCDAARTGSTPGRPTHDALRSPSADVVRVIGRPTGRPFGRVLLAVVLAVLGWGHAASAVTGTSTTGSTPATGTGAIGAIVTATTGSGTATTGTTGTTTTTKTRMTRAEVTRIARTSTEAQRWIRDHPIVRTTASPDHKKKVWTVSFVNADNRTEAAVLVDDRTGTITETRTGPQVAWSMARGYDGAFGRSLTSPQIWIPLFVMFLVPLIRWRRPFTWHTLDLIAMCGFAVSLVWFNRGEIFTSVPLAYPPLVYLLVRLLVVGLRRPREPAPADDADGDTAPRIVASRPRAEGTFPVWVMVAVTCLAMGLRLGLNAWDANVIDVGYAGVIGADRITDGYTPYGTFPSDCRQCDTYGPVNYLAYVPFEAVAPWEGRWNDLPAAHLAAITFDLLTLAGLALLGWRLGGRTLAAMLALAWATQPFTAYALESNSNDSLLAAFAVWGLVLAHRPVGRGVMIGLAALAKFTPALLIPLWARHPFPLARRTRRVPRYVMGLAIAAVASGWVIMLDGVEGARRFYDRTLGFQFGRESPFSIWGQYPGLRPVQLALSVLVVVAAIAFIRWPRRLDLRRFAALSGALTLGLQLTLTHWFYLYIPWFLPFALVALVPVWSRPTAAPAPQPEPAPAPPSDEVALASRPTPEPA